MQPSRQHCLCALLVLFAVSAPAPCALADNLTITSSPPGATVEIDGTVAGTTPYKVDYPGGYFHKTHSVFGMRLEHSMILRISKGGYLAQQVTITSGPYEWVGLTGHRHGNYFLLNSDHFEIKLETSSTSGVSSDTSERAGPMRMHPSPEGRIDPAVSATESTEKSLQGGLQADANSGTVEIASEPAGADIFIDAKFVGQTPSTIRLPAGSHHVEVKSQGKQVWSRDLEVLKDSQLTLHAVFDASP